MNERLAYEQYLQEHWNDVTLPDVDMAWMDMKRRLDEEEDRPVIPFWRSCAGKIVLAVLLVAIGWWLVKPQKWFHADTASREKSTSDSSFIDKDPGTVDTLQTRKRVELRSEKDIKKQKPASVNLLKTPRKTRPQKRKENQELVVDPVLPDKIVDSTHARKELSNHQMIETGETHDTMGIVSMRVSGINMEKHKDTTATPPIPKKDSLLKTPISFSAGIAMQQQLPIDGQKFVPYNSVGRKGTIADYIPSLYFRVHRKKVFFQSEFKYGAPQYVRERLFIQSTDSNIITQKLSIASSRIKKTYYHQLPLTLNLYVTRDWSVGAGVVWNKFSAAITEQEVLERNLLTGADSLIVPAHIVRQKKADSNFVNTYWQALFETQYKLGRFSFGARYAFGLQPFIQFTLPGGSRQQEKNSSFQIFIRYDLFKF